MGDYDKAEKRKNLLSELKDLVDNIPNSCVGPVIEIYDPLPKPCLPICSPAGGPAPGGPPPGGFPPSAGGPPGCCPGTCPPPSAPVPIIFPSPPPPSNPCCVPPVLPICTPVNPPCVPICNPTPEEQPCVPCNPPAMMVCYRRPKTNMFPATRSKSRELRASKLYVGCDCDRHYGLQDSCPRMECQGAPECLSHPPVCGPSLAKRASQMGARSSQLEEYQCYPAYVKLPTSCPPFGPSPPMGPPGQSNGGPPSNGAYPPPSGPCPPPCCPSCVPPCVPLIAQAPCPPPICPGPPPLVPVGQVVPMCPIQCSPCPMPPCCPCPC